MRGIEQGRPQIDAVVVGQQRTDRRRVEPDHEAVLRGHEVHREPLRERRRMAVGDERGNERARGGPTSLAIDRRTLASAARSRSRCRRCAVQVQHRTSRSAASARARASRARPCRRSCARRARRPASRARRSTRTRHRRTPRPCAAACRARSDRAGASRRARSPQSGRRSTTLRATVRQLPPEPQMPCVKRQPACGLAAARSPRDGARAGTRRLWHGGSVLADAGFDIAHAFDAASVASFVPAFGGPAMRRARRQHASAVGAVHRGVRHGSRARRLGRSARALHGSTRSRARSPGAPAWFGQRRYDGAFLPFQRIAVAAGLGVLAPTQLVIHPMYGPWFALRAVVLVDGEPPPSRPIPTVPCCTSDCAARLEIALAASRLARVARRERRL